MSRNIQIEAILEAWWDSLHSELSQRADARSRLEKLLDETIGSQPLTRDDVLNFLHDRFLEYRKERRKRESVSIAQSRRV